MARCKPWATKKWKLQREELLKNTECYWCGSKERLVIHHTHETRIKNRVISDNVIAKIIKSRIDSGNLVPLGKKGRLSKEQYLEIINQNRSTIEKQLLPEIDYSEIKDLKENGEIIVLCNRCHFALHHHMRLCPECKKKYTRYTICYSCHCRKSTMSSEDFEVISVEDLGVMDD